MGRDERGREGEGGKVRRGEREGKGRMERGGEGGRVGPPKLKLAPQNYFPGAGADDIQLHLMISSIS